MKVEYGHVKKYFAKKGHSGKSRSHGFVTRTFDNTIRQKNQDILFYISTIEDDFPNLAKQLNNGLGKDVYFWYLIDTSERDKVEKIWMDINDIPDPYQKDLFSYIEQLSNHLPPLLEQINNICIATKKHKRQTPVSNRLKLRETDKAKPVEIEAKKVDVHKIEPEKSELKKAQTYEIIRDENYYAGLPKDLINRVFWVEREFRIHYLSHIPGGHNLIFEFYDNRILEYDWVHSPCAYIRKIICDSIGCELNEFNHLRSNRIMNTLKKEFYRIFIKQYRDNSSSTLFQEVWNSDTFDSVPTFLLLGPRYVEFYCDTEKDILDFLTKLKEQQARDKEEYRERRRTARR